LKDRRKSLSPTKKVAKSFALEGSLAVEPFFFFIFFFTCKRGTTYAYYCLCPLLSLKLKAYLKPLSTGGGLVADVLTGY
jgi:hypothetical protein